VNLWARALVTAFGFLTRLPVWLGPVTEMDLGRAVAFFPWVGLVLGFVTTGLVQLAGQALSPLLTASLLAALLAALTGALHLDGLSDLFDGVGGGRGDREKMLAIMRDSRIGAHGATALVLCLVAKIAALAVVVERRDLLTLLAFPALARWAVAPLIVLFPYVRSEGLGRAFNGAAGVRELVLASVAIGALVLALGPRAGWQALVALAVTLVVAFWMRARLGGLTGDVYGAAIELSELGVLLAGCMLRA
jgi:adenosylcobinamide-GDP ribazoletransferase